MVIDKQVPIDAAARADDVVFRGVHESRPTSLARLALVNVMCVGVFEAGEGRWVIIDAGIPGSTGALGSAAEHRFGEMCARPRS